MNSAIQEAPRTETEIRIAGLEGNIKELRAKRDVLIRASTLQEQIDKFNKAAGDIETKLDQSKTRRGAKESKRREAARLLCGNITKVMNTVLPEGEAWMDIDDAGKVDLGWKLPGQEQPVHWQSLSGGQAMAWSQALALALFGDASGRLLILEAGEIDTKRLDALLERLLSEEVDAQVIVNTCHGLSEFPEGWQTIRLSAESERPDDAHEGETEATAQTMPEAVHCPRSGEYVGRLKCASCSYRHAEGRERCQIYREDT